MQRIHEEGHEMGNHLVNDEPSWRLSSEQFENDLLECDNLIQQYVDDEDRMKWVRPGSGFFTKAMMKTCKKHQYRIVLGDVHSFDAQIRNHWWNTRFVCKKVSKGSIIIVHDRDYNQEALRYILQDLVEKRNYQLVTLSELVQL
jgi:peptidoglycan-N-acetylglucosamine deacetylase